MHTLRCIAIDDEPLALDLIEDNIRNTPFLTLVARCCNAMEALQVLQRESIDLVFSDIQMPGLNGLQLISTLPVKSMFILISAHEKFALESYSLDVVDYLLKPVAYERFLKACNKALERYNARNYGAAPVTGPVRKEFIFLPLDYKMLKVELQNITFIEGVKDYIRIHFNAAKSPLLIRMSMKAIEEVLTGTSLLRIHKSYIINIRYLTAIRKNSVFIAEMEFPVAEQYRNAVLKLAEGY